MIERDIAVVTPKLAPKHVEPAIIPVTEATSASFKVSEFLRGGIASMVNITATYPVYKLVFRQQVFCLTVSCIKCHLLTTVAIIMRQFEDRCHNSMHWYANIVSKSVYNGSNGFFSWCFIKPCCHSPLKHCRSSGWKDSPTYTGESDFHSHLGASHVVRRCFKWMRLISPFFTNIMRLISSIISIFMGLLVSFVSVYGVLLTLNGYHGAQMMRRNFSIF